MANPETISSGEKINKLSTEIKSLENKLIQNLPQEEKDKLNDEIASKKQEIEELKQLQKKEVSDKLLLLKQAIETGRFNVELTKELIAEIKEVPKEKKPFVLSMVFSGLNFEGISLGGVTSNKILLKSEKDQSKAEEFEKSINEGINTGDFSIDEIKKALLYRTSNIDELLKKDGTKKPQSDIDKLKGRDVFYGLLEKYHITLEGGDDFSKLDEKSLKQLKNIIAEKTQKNPTDRDFMLAYVDDSFSNKGEGFNKEGMISEYSKLNDENIEEITSSIENLSDLEKARLGFNSNKPLKDTVGETMNSLTKNTGEFLSQNGERAPFLILGLALSFFGLKGKGIFSKLFGALGAYLTVASIPGASDKIGDVFNGLLNGKNTAEAKERKSEIYGNIPDLKFSDKETQEMYDYEKSNDLFLEKDISLLYIFEEEDTKHSPEKIISKLKTVFGDGVNTGNYLKYKKLFSSIIREHNLQNGIAEVGVNGNMKIGKYLELRSNSGNGIKPAVVAGNLEGKKEGNKSIEINDVNSFEKLGYTINGKNYIIGENGEAKLVEYSMLSDEYKDLIDKLKLSGKIVSNFSLLLNSLVKKDEEKYSKLLEDFQTKTQNIDISNKEDIEKLIEWINLENSKITNPHKNRRGNPYRHLNKGINLEDDNEVIKYIRNIDSDMAKNILADKLFDLTNISSKELEEIINNPTGEYQKLKNLLGDDYDDFRSDLIEKKAESDNYFIKNSENFKNQIKTQNPNLTDAEINKILQEEYKPSIKNSFCLAYSKNKLLEKFLENNNEKDWSGEYIGNNELLKTYGDIVGVGVLDFSDESLDWGAEALLLIGTEIIALGAGALTMGVGAYAVNAAVWGARGYKGMKWLQRGSKVLEYGSEASRLTKMGKGAARLGVNSVVEGSSFYAGYGLVQSGIEGKNMYSTEGLMESIAFIGAFKTLSKLGIELKQGVALSEQKFNIAKVLTIDTAVFGGMGLGFDGILFEPGEWTADNFVNAFAMAVIFRGMGHLGGKIKFSKKGEEVILEGSSSTPVKFFKNEKTGTTYKQTADGKFYNSKGKELKTTPKNITEVKLENQHLGKDGYKDFESNYYGLKEKTIGENSENILKAYKNSKEFRKYIDKNLSKNGEVTIGGVTIKKVEKGFTINGDNNTIYTKLDKVIEEISLKDITKFKDESIIKYYLGSDKVRTVKNENGDYKLSKKGIYKVEEGKELKLSKEETDKFLEKLIETDPKIRVLEEKAIDKALKEIKTTKLKDFFEKNGKKVNESKFLKFFEEIGYFKGGNIKQAYNLTIGEFFTIPKVIKQFGAFAEKHNKSEGVNLLKTLAYGDKNRGHKAGIARGIFIYGGLTNVDGLLGIDSDDNELVDAIQYSALGWTTQALSTFIFSGE